MPFPILAALGLASSVAGAVAANERAKKQRELQQNLASESTAIGKMDALGGQRSVIPEFNGIEGSAPESKPTGLGGFNLAQFQQLANPTASASGPSPAMSVAAPALKAVLSVAGADPGNVEGAADAAGAVGDVAATAGVVPEVPAITAGLDQVAKVAAPTAAESITNGVKDMGAFSGTQYGGGVDLGPSSTSAWDGLAKTWGTNDQGLKNLPMSESYGSVSTDAPNSPIKDLPYMSRTYSGVSTETPGVDDIVKGLNISDVAPASAATGANTGVGEQNDWSRIGKMLAEKAGGAAVNTATAAAIQAVMRRKKPKYGTGGGFAGFYGR